MLPDAQEIDDRYRAAREIRSLLTIRTIWLLCTGACFVKNSPLAGMKRVAVDRGATIPPAVVTSSCSA